MGPARTPTHRTNACRLPAICRQNDSGICPAAPSEIAQVDVTCAAQKRRGAWLGPTLAADVPGRAQLPPGRDLAGAAIIAIAVCQLLKTAELRYDGRFQGIAPSQTECFHRREEEAEQGQRRRPDMRAVRDDRKADEDQVLRAWICDDEQNYVMFVPSSTVFVESSELSTMRSASAIFTVLVALIVSVRVGHGLRPGGWKKRGGCEHRSWPVALGPRVAQRRAKG